MADLALRVKIFIAPPNDVAAERDIAENVIQEMEEECARQRLLVHTFRWEKQLAKGKVLRREIVCYHVNRSAMGLRDFTKLIEAPFVASYDYLGWNGHTSLFEDLNQSTSTDPFTIGPCGSWPDRAHPWYRGLL